MSSKNLDDLFQDSLQGREFSPSDASWADMQSMLNDSQLDGMFHSKLANRAFTPTRSGWRKAAAMLPKSSATIFMHNALKVAAGVAAIIGIAGVSYLFISPTNNQQYNIRTESLAHFSSPTNSNESLRFSIVTSNAEIADKSISALTSNESSQATESLSLEASISNQQSVGASSTGNSKSVIANNSRNAGLIALNQSNAYRSALINNAANRIEETLSLTVLSVPSLNQLSENNQLVFNEIANGFVYLNNYKKPKPVKKHRLGVIGGFNLAQGYASGAQSGNVAGNVFGGISYNYFINHKFVLHADLLYQGRNGVETNKILSSTSYNFGKTQSQVSLTNKRLHYAELPIHIGYRITPKLQAIAGASVAYMFAGKNEITHNFTSDFESWSTTHEETGVPEGFNQVDLAISTGVAYSVTPSIEAGIRLNYGITDVTDNTYFSNAVVDRNVQLRFNLAYRFLNF